jgi:multidrug efflux pump
MSKRSWVKLSNTAIDRRTTVFVLLLLIILVGAYSLHELPTEAEPEIVVPYIVVTTQYDGVTPEDMESLITIPIERKLTGISGIKEITSTTLESRSTIVIEFEADMVIEDALQRVRDKVDLAESDLPEDADDPVVNEINLGEMPILYMCLTGDLPLAVLTDIAEDFEDQIETIAGVLDVEIVGGVEREIQIVVDPDRVAEYGISFADLISVTRLENVNTPGGAMNLGEAKFNMRTPGEFTTPDEITGLPVKTGPNGTVYLRDVATVRDGFKELTSRSRVNGRPAVTLTVAKRSGENIIEVVDDVNAEVAGMLASLPAGVDMAVTWDESVWVRDLVSELRNSILSGLILVVAVIFIFLGIANAIFVALAIPISMLITFAVLYFCDITLNMVVLFSLTLSLGMLVDNGIVVVENIYRHYQSGLDRVTAAKVGTAEVAWPITASTLTTVAAFAPMFFWPGIFGEFMMFLPITVCVALTASLFVGLVVNPALTAVFMRVRRHGNGGTRKELPHLLRFYGGFLRLAIQWRAVTVTVAVASLVIIGGVYFKDARTIFLPETEPPQAYVRIECPEGTNLDTSDAIVAQIEALLEPYADNTENLVSRIGSQTSGSFKRGKGTTTHLSQVTIDFPKLHKCTRLPSAIVEEMRDLFKPIVGAQITVDKEDMGPPTGPPINVEISGEEFETLAALAGEIEEWIRDIPGLVDLQDDYDKGKPEVKVVVDREQAWRMGLNTTLVGLTIKAAVDGRKAADYREGDEEYDVVVRFPDSFRADLRNIEDMNLINMAGQPVPFSEVARIEQSSGLGRIRRIERKRTITVSAEVAGDRTAPEVLDDVRARLDDFPTPQGYSIAFTGENKEMEETAAFLKKAFVVAIFLIALVLITQFNSVLQPLIILSSVLLSLAGVFLGLHIFNMPFGILMTGIGCISLAGVVVNNAIVLLDFINQLRSRGLTVEDAIVEAGVTRFRPVMLTAVTTILGLIPMAIGVSFDFFSWTWVLGGESSQWWGSMAVAVIFGLAFATVLTLVVVPALYSYMDSLSSVFVRAVPEVAPTGEEAPAK